MDAGDSSNLLHQREYHMQNRIRELEEQNIELTQQLILKNDEIGQLNATFEIFINDQMRRETSEMRREIIKLTKRLEAKERDEKERPEASESDDRER